MCINAKHARPCNMKRVWSLLRLMVTIFWGVVFAIVRILRIYRRRNDDYISIFWNTDNTDRDITFRGVELWVITKMILTEKPNERQRRYTNREGGPILTSIGRTWRAEECVTRISLAGCLEIVLDNVKWIWYNIRMRLKMIRRMYEQFRPIFWLTIAAYLSLL